MNSSKKTTLQANKKKNHTALKLNSDMIIMRYKSVKLDDHLTISHVILNLGLAYYPSALGNIADIIFGKHSLQCHLQVYHKNIHANI